MKCLECQFDNREGAKFCKECGHKLELACPSCGHSYQPDSTFCDECGHNLTVPSEPTPKDLSFDEKIDKIQRYLPKGLTEKILSRRDKIEGERKHVTVMFCDMEGFTPLVEKLGPEAAYGVMDEVYEILIHKVHDFGGTVNEMTGDGIMALFGAPIALEDAPQRAVRSAFAIHRGMARLTDKLKKEKEVIPRLKMRIGIHTGPVVVGTLGNNLRVEFKAVGDTVNLASRMEGLADPGAIYLTDDTFKLTEGLFRFEALGEKEVKGKEKPVKIYRAIAPSTRRTRFDVNAERGLTPFVGRGRELDLLLEGFERSKGGRGQAFSIMAEAGVGKSRLLYEFRKAVANEDVTFLEGKCLSYSRGVTYHPVIDILQSNFDIREVDGDSEITEKVKRGLKILEVEEEATLPYLLELLSVKDSGVDKIPMSPEAMKDRIIEAVKRISLKGSEIRPLIVAIEDLHWIDKSSEDYLKAFLESMSGSRVFLILTYRPEFAHDWGSRSYHSRLTLNKLSDRESIAMAPHILGAEEIDGKLEELILDKTEGIPFFIEEFIRSLRDLNLIEIKDKKCHLRDGIQDLAIPSTIQDVIMARVDSLPDSAKRTLQIGSVIEREFSYDLISRIADLFEEELIADLSALNDAELLYERGIYPQTTYIFKHALTGEVVYNSILSTRRKDLHEEIGNAIEELYKGNLYEHYEILSEHYGEAENFMKAAEYSKLAGKKAAKTASVKSAIAFAHKTVNCLERLPHSEDLEKGIISARIALGLYYGQLNYFRKAKEIIDPVIDPAVKHGLKKALARMYNILGPYYAYVQGNREKGIEYLKQAITTSEAANDLLAFTQANFWLGCGLGMFCNFDQSSQCFEKALRMSIAAKSPWGISTTKSNWAFFTYWYQGNIGKTYELGRESVDLAEESADIFSKSWAYLAYGCSCYGKGLLKEAVEYLSKGVECCEKIDAVSTNSITLWSLGNVHFEYSKYEDSAYCYRKALENAKSISLYPCYQNMLRIALAMAESMDMDKRMDLESLREYANGIKTESNEGWAARYMAQIFLNRDDDSMSEAEEWIKKAVEADKRNGMMFNLGKDYVFYSDFLKGKGDKSNAKENLGKAIDIFNECGADGWVEKYEKELAAIS
jgi:class 3 adenylate cyclase/tetratricopeptide (TPR) repeat protein